jgi:hypothetical protein
MHVAELLPLTVWKQILHKQMETTRKPPNSNELKVSFAAGECNDDGLPISLEKKTRNLTITTSNYINFPF